MGSFFGIELKETDPTSTAQVHAFEINSDFGGRIELVDARDEEGDGVNEDGCRARDRSGTPPDGGGGVHGRVLICERELVEALEES